MDIQLIHQFVETKRLPAELNIEELKEELNKHPYCQGTIFLYLKWMYTHYPHLFQAEFEKKKPLISNEKQLLMVIFEEKYQQLFPIKENQGRLSMTDRLLDSVPDYDFSPFEMALLTSQELSHSSATTDYFAHLQETIHSNIDSEDTPAPLRHQDAIDAFIQKSEQGSSLKIDSSSQVNSTAVSTKEEEPLEDDLFFTETLAQIYVKQKKYKQAHKIISRLHLNYPEKNTYFADQIRFLERLIENTPE